MEAFRGVWGAESLRMLIGVESSLTLKMSETKKNNKPKQVDSPVPLPANDAASDFARRIRNVNLAQQQHPRSGDGTQPKITTQVVDPSQIMNPNVTVLPSAQPKPGRVVPLGIPPSMPADEAPQDAQNEFQSPKVDVPANELSEPEDSHLNRNSRSSSRFDDPRYDRIAPNASANPAPSPYENVAGEAERIAEMWKSTPSQQYSSKRVDMTHATDSQ